MTGTNRNRVLGDYATHAAPRMSLAEAIRLSMDKRNGRVPEDGRVSTEVWNHGEFSLRRYRLGSDELRRDGEAVGADVLVLPELRDCTSLFGIVDGHGEGACRAVIEVIEEDRRGFLVTNVTGGADVPPDALHALVHVLDVPANAGTDHSVEERFGLRWDGASGWRRVEPVHAVAVTFSRTCFSTRPVLEERVDVLVALDPAYRLDDPDEEAAYRARYRYRGLAADEFDLSSREGPARPGFCTWGYEGEPRLVRVLGASMQAHVERQRERALDPGDEGGEEPAGPRM